MTVVNPTPAALRPNEALAGISSLEIDSRAVQPGALFVALRGTNVDGHRFIGEAIARGARAVVMEEPREVPAHVRSYVVKDSAATLSQLATAFYGAPADAMQMLGVTGTNGKTTVVHMIASICAAAGMPCATVGTLGAQFGSDRWNLSNTTPLAHDLQRLLAELRDAGAKAVAMEVSSHALELHRVEGVRFACAALTNVTRDHLDFHGSEQRYRAAKRRLFDSANSCVMNSDDETGAAWAHELRGAHAVTTYGLQAAADLCARDVEAGARASYFTLREVRMMVPLPGRFNVSNALAAVGVAMQIGVSLEACVAGLAALAPVAGRMEYVQGYGIDVVVDYAHTPNALRAALSALRESSPARLTVVFGCGGDRDRGKRPEMGAVAAELADRVILTSDNPRSEDPRAVIAEIEGGLGGIPHLTEPDRASAIHAAIGQAISGETVLIAGKGHETYQIIGEKKLDFDDRKVAQVALARRSRA